MQTTTNHPIRPIDAAAAQLPASAPAPDEHRRAPVLNFVRHYAEMIVAMLLGMFILGAALAVPLELAGVDVSNWSDDAPALALLGMAVTMTVPMVAWMRYRGHGWAASRDMTLAMFVPTFVAIGLLWSAVASDSHGPMMFQHIAMFPSMLLAMLLRRNEYTGH